jgi:mRNA deadenylase 3'-5' endonuclease subunit Ccr4
MIEVATRTKHPRSRGERTKRRHRHQNMSTEKERCHAVSVKIALSNEKNGNYILVSATHSTLTRSVRRLLVTANVVRS